MPKKTLSGVVVLVSASTVKVEVVETKKHPVLGKPIKRKRTYLAHSVGNPSIGSVVTLQESKPISKHKKWLVVD